MLRSSCAVTPIPFGGAANAVTVNRDKIVCDVPAGCGQKIAMRLFVWLSSTAWPFENDQLPARIAPSTVPSTKPSNTAIEFPTAVGDGSQLSPTPSPSESMLSAAPENTGHGSQTSPNGSPSSLAWSAFARFGQLSSAFITPSLST